MTTAWFSVWPQDWNEAKNKPALKRSILKRFITLWFDCDLIDQRLDHPSHQLPGLGPQVVVVEH